MQGGPRITHLDDVPMEEMLRFVFSDGRTASIWERWIEMSPRYVAFWNRRDPGAMSPLHGHTGDHINLILKGEIRCGEVVCGEGTHIMLEWGDLFGPWEAGPELRAVRVHRRRRHALLGRPGVSKHCSTRAAPRRCHSRCPSAYRRGCSPSWAAVATSRTGRHRPDHSPEKRSRSAPAMGRANDQRRPIRLVGQRAGLDGTVAIVTGGAGGLGEAISLDLAANGVQVAVLDLTSRPPSTASAEALAGDDVIDPARRRQRARACSTSSSPPPRSAGAGSTRSSTSSAARSRRRSPRRAQRLGRTHPRQPHPRAARHLAGHPRHARRWTRRQHHQPHHHRGPPRSARTSPCTRRPRRRRPTSPAHCPSSSPPTASASTTSPPTSPRHPT